MSENMFEDGIVALKWRRLMDNAKFKSANVGRSSPVPQAHIRASDRPAAEALKKEIGGGKIKKKGNTYYLIIGPSILRDLLPEVYSTVRRNYKAIEIVTEWLKLLVDNQTAKDEEIVESNRRRILNLKDSLIEMNKASSQSVEETLVTAGAELLKQELAMFTKVPEHLRSPYQLQKIDSLMLRIAEKEPESKEAKICKERGLLG